MPQTYKVEVNCQDNTQTIEVREDQTVLEAAKEAGLELPSSCTAGVCTTCAAKLVEGEVSQDDAMGLSPDLRAEGYALLCVSYPRSDLKVLPGQEDAVYDKQFGRT